VKNQNPITNHRPLTTDLNCDMGEGYRNDAELMNFVSSINVACGFHAGDAHIMRETVQLAVQKGINIGSHPSYLDLENFGRSEKNLSAQEVFDIVLYQNSVLKGICEAFGAKLHHVKPHGALYNQAAKDKILAQAIAESVKSLDKNLILYGLSGSFLISEAEKIGLQTKSEVFADRTYQADGSLTPRILPNALIKNVDDSIEQVLQMVETQTVTATNGETVNLKAETICIHGDGENAVEFAKAIYQKLIL
jgi:5-oxoprolinase (ATP-hydrolysing) subunit A